MFGEKKQGLFGGRPLVVEATCDKGGYVPGETINILLQISNDSEYDVTRVKVGLEQVGHVVESDVTIIKIVVQSNKF